MINREKIKEFMSDVNYEGILYIYVGYSYLAGRIGDSNKTQILAEQLHKLTKIIPKTESMELEKITEIIQFLDEEHMERFNELANQQKKLGAQVQK